MKIVSGGQTGADRAALDFAIAHNIECGGWVPKGRLAEDGPIPERYSMLRETNFANYPERTRKNVEDSDATLIITHGRLTGGSLLTKKIAVESKRPCLHLDLLRDNLKTSVEILKQWIDQNGVEVLNVAGPRSSGDPKIYNATRDLLTMLFD